MLRVFIVGLLFMMLSPGIGKAQEEEMIIEPLMQGNSCRFVFDNSKGSINIIGYDGGVVIVNGKLRDSQSAGLINTGSLRKLEPYRFNLSAEVKETEIVLKCESYNRTVDFDILVPRSFSLSIASQDNGQITILGTDGEIEARNPNGSINAENITGPVVLNTVFGKSRVVFSRVPTGKLSMIKSYDGDVEIVLPGGSSADFSLKTARGEIFTDLDLKTVKRETKVSTERNKRIYEQEEWFRAKLNKGGTEFIISTYYGNISLKSRDNVTL
jgi:hypothetical protein